MRETAARSSEKGSALIEFVLSFSLFLLPLFLGTLVIGFNLIRAVQVTEVCRDAGHMYSRSVDFTLTGSRAVLARLAAGLNLDTVGSSGNGVLILSTIRHVSSSDCTTGGLAANNSSCANFDKVVFTQQQIIGDSTKKGSTQIGLAPSGDLGASGKISPTGSNGFLLDTKDQVPSPPAGITLNPGDYAYVSEMWIQSPDYRWYSSLGTPNIGARSIF